MKLPTVPISINSRNPNWVLNPDLPYLERMTDYNITHHTHAEVLTIHLQKGTMRVRYVDACNQTQIADISADAFFREYEIVKK